MGDNVFVYGLLFVGVLLTVEGLYLLYYDWRYGTTRHLNRRLADLSKRGQPESVLVALRRARANEKAGVMRAPILGPLLRRARKADIPLNPFTLLLLLIFLSGGLYLLFDAALRFPVGVSLLLAALSAYMLTLTWLNGRVAAKLARFEEQLPDALDLISRSLRLGHPVAFAVAAVGREMPNPIGSEFEQTADEITYGMTVSEGLDRLSDRIDSQDLRFLAMAVSIQQQSGGSLAEVIDNLSRIVRSRFQMFRKVNAITAEGRWSGWFLSLFPIAIIFAVRAVQPDYFDLALESPNFRILGLVALLMLVVNIVFMRTISTIKV